MSEASIGRIAIIIFALVFSTAIDARLSTGLAVGVGLLLIDQLGWQGKWSGLASALWSYRSAHYRARILHHEAGHLLAAYLLDILILDYVLDPWQAFRKGYPGYGGVKLDPGPKWLDRKQVKQGELERYGIVWMAGSVAERQFAGTSIGDLADRRQIRQMLQILRQKSGQPLDILTMENHFQHEAEKLLSNHLDAYSAVVQAMEKGSSLSECLDSIAQVLASRQDPSHSHH